MAPLVFILQKISLPPLTVCISFFLFHCIKASLLMLIFSFVVALFSAYVLN